ncbi:hypothetical protein NX059_001295 [Plenodomus lindquistii]|nr:hypothetical protein NX059_001295 [Plenodomus lindquistii]
MHALAILLSLSLTLTPTLAWLSRDACCSVNNCWDCDYNGAATDGGSTAVCGSNCVSAQANGDIGYRCFGCLEGCPASPRLNAQMRGSC